MSTITHYKRRRAAKACLSCRKRKVRCDYATTGSPCSNCREDGFECSAVERRKRQKSTVAAPEPTVVAPSTSVTRRNESASAIDSLSATPEDNDQVLVRRTSSFSRHRMLHSVPHYAFLMRLSQTQAPDAIPLEDVVLKLASDRTRGTSAPASKCGEDELNYLKSTGSLDVPAPHLVSALLDAYFSIFHPFFPVVERVQFLQSVKLFEHARATGPNAQQSPTSVDPGRVHGDPPFSLLLLQAVLFIAVGVAPSHLITTAGFASRKKARHAYYSKARRLYDMDHEQDPIATIQALLLISQYYPSITERKHTWHWIHQAISLSQVSGLHKDPGQVPHRALWARIWWACVVRDRCNGLGTGRPLMINSLDCSTKMIVLEDVIEEGDSEQDIEVKTIFIEFVKLCQIVEGIITLRCSGSATDVAPPDQLKVCEDALAHWMQSLPFPANRQDHLPTTAENANIATMYRTILHACYNTIRIALYQSLTLWNGAVDWATTCQDKVEFAALDSTQLFTHLVNLDLVKFCPTIAVTFTLAPLIVHVLGIRSSKSAERPQVHKNRFELCMIFLRQLKDIYWHAIFYCEFFELAASIKNDQLRTGISEAQDPLASFLTQRISMGDLMVLRHYQDVGNAGSVDDAYLTSPVSPSYRQQWTQDFGMQGYDRGPQVQNQAHSDPTGEFDHVYSRGAEPMKMSDWLAAHSRAGQSIPFA